MKPNSYSGLTNNLMFFLKFGILKIILFYSFFLFLLFFLRRESVFRAKYRTKQNDCDGRNGYKHNCAFNTDTNLIAIEEYITPDELLFAQQYAIYRDGYQSLKSAGLLPQGTIREQIRQSKVITRQLLSNIYIQKAIQTAVLEKIKRMEVTEDKVISQLSRIAFFDPKNLIDGTGKFKQMEQMDLDTRSCITEITHKSLFGEKNKQSGCRAIVGRVTKVKFADRIPALKLLLEKILNNYSRDKNNIHIGDVNISNDFSQSVNNDIDIDSLDEKQLDTLLDIFTANRKTTPELDQIEQMGIHEV